jgi:hypothetical protein
VERYIAKKINVVSDQKWDPFISHASEDKRAFVVPPAVALTAFGAKIWYDEVLAKLSARGNFLPG